MRKITPDEWSRYCVNTRDMWDVVTRCGYYLPKFKSKMITEEYMDNVIRKKAWCPRFEDIKMIPCPTPPNKNVLIDKFYAFIQANKLLLVGVEPEKHVPDKRWLLDVLSSFTPGDEIFAKSYKPPPKKGRLADYTMIEIPEQVIHDQPFSTRKTRRRGLRIIKDGLRMARQERYTELRKKYFKNMVEEEAEEEEKKQGRKRLFKENEMMGTTFKAPSTPTKFNQMMRSGSTAGSANQDLLNTSISPFDSQTDFAMSHQVSPSSITRLEQMSVSGDKGSKASKKGNQGV